VTWVLPDFAFNVADLLVVAGGAGLLIARYCDRKSTQPGLGYMRRAAA
jgi:hypothetical protein